MGLGMFGLYGLRRWRWNGFGDVGALGFKGGGYGFGTFGV